MSAETKSNKSIEELVHNLRKLPAFPKIALDLFDRIQSPTSTSAEISAILSTEPALSAKILRLANSGYYSIPGGVKDIRKALEYLGFNTIAQVILTSTLPQLFQSHGTSNFQIHQFWKKSLAIAVASEIHSKEFGISNSSEAFTCGLLLHVGKLVCMELFPMNFDQIQTEAKRQEFNFDESAASFKFYTSQYLGTEICDQWKLPTAVRDCIAHSKPEKSMSGLVHTANLFASALKIGDSADYRAVSKDQVPAQWLEEPAMKKFTDQFDRAGAFFNA